MFRQALLERLDVCAAAAVPGQGRADHLCDGHLTAVPVDHVADLRRIAVTFDELVAARPPQEDEVTHGGKLPNYRIA